MKIEINNFFFGGEKDIIYTFYFTHLFLH